MSDRGRTATSASQTPGATTPEPRTRGRLGGIFAKPLGRGKRTAAHAPDERLSGSFVLGANRLGRSSRLRANTPPPDAAPSTTTEPAPPAATRHTEDQ